MSSSGNNNNNKISYQALVSANLIRREIEPGDLVTMTIRNEESEQGAFALAERVMYLFLHCYGFLPESVTLHPDHITVIKKQEKSLDITLTEEMAMILGKILELDEIPRRVPFIADPDLDLFSATASFYFRKEEAAERAVEGLKIHFRLNTPDDDLP